jgi:preprotein translocase SecE subunit
MKEANTQSGKAEPNKVNAGGSGAGKNGSAKKPAKTTGDNKKAESKKDEAGGIGKSLREAKQFLREVKIEFTKISWPDRASVIRDTQMVLVLVTAITLMVLAFDWAVGTFVFKPLDKWAHSMGGGVGSVSKTGSDLGQPIPQDLPLTPAPVPAGSVPVAPSPDAAAPTSSVPTTSGSTSAETKASTAPADTSTSTPQPATPAKK